MRWIGILCFLMSMGAACFADTVRTPVVAGAFYPNQPTELSELIDHYMESVTLPELPDDIAVLISPHAGYIYSGPVAAYGYKAVQGKHYDVVVVLAVSHRFPFQGVSIFEGTHYETPLGTIPLEANMIRELRSAHPFIHYEPRAEAAEHSLEVQLPFLQRALGEFQLVPIIFGDHNYAAAAEVGKTLAHLAQGKQILVVASTDLSHYRPYQEAQQYDRETIHSLMSGNSDIVTEYFEHHDEAACGKCPVIAALSYAQAYGAHEIKELWYANSGDTQGNKSNVVGYVSVAMGKKGALRMTNLPEKETLTETSKRELLALVRTTITEYLTSKTIQPVTSNNPELQGKNGAFVTLHTQSGQLRGCIGNFVSDKPLYRTVQEMALQSAFHDPRFEPVKRDEIKTLSIEISVLSPMQRITDVNEIILGTHGIYIRKGMRGGTFLPQVATETGWTLEEFLGHCSQDKAGIGWEGWKEAEIFVYTADVFGEE